jgi:uncharacterized membrane protein
MTEAFWFALQVIALVGLLIVTVFGSVVVGWALIVVGYALALKIVGRMFAGKEKP